MLRWSAPADGTYRDWLEAFLDANERWTRSTFEAQKILLGAARRSGEDAGNALTTEGTSVPALGARAADPRTGADVSVGGGGFCGGRAVGTGRAG